MASKRVLEKKQKIVSELTEKLEKASVGILVDYKGINVEDDTALRKSLRDAGSEYFVTKNTMLKRATKIEELFPYLEGPTVVALSEKGDYTSAAKILYDFSKKHEFFKIKAGFIDGKFADKNQIVMLSKLPSKEILLAQVLRGLNSPIAGFVNILNAVLRNFVIIINQIAKQKQA